MNAEKLKAQYEKSVDTALEKLIDKVTPSVHNFCDKYGVQFLAGNGVYGIATPEEKQGITNSGFEFYSYGRSNADNRWLIDYFDSQLTELLEIQLPQRCCLGCQLENYTPCNKYKDAYICVKELINPDEFEVRFSYIPSLDLEYDTYGPISEKLAIDIFAAYKKDSEIGLKLIFGCLQKYREGLGE